MREYIVCPYCHNPLSQSEYVKVVRCRDCKCFDDETSLCYRIGKFPEWHACTEPDGFCAWGVRRDG